MHAVGPGTFLAAPSFLGPCLCWDAPQAPLPPVGCRELRPHPEGKVGAAGLGGWRAGDRPGCALPPARLQVPRVRQGRPEPRGAPTAAPGKSRPANFSD